jgi:Right handed beta helix region
MASNGISEHGVDGLSIADRREETRRALLAKAGLVAGTVGIATALRAQEASATHLPGQQPQPEDFDGYFNIKHFGAVAAPLGDPTTNTASIQACLDAAAGKAAVYIPPGVFETNAALAVPDNSVIRGVGPQSVIKDVATTQAAIRGAASGLAKNVVIDHIKVDRTLGTVSGSARCFWFSNGSERIFIRHVECVGQVNSSTGIEVDASYSAVQNCYVHNCGLQGIVNLSTTAVDMLIADNVVVECGDDHIATAARRSTIVGNVCNAGASATADTGQLGAAIAVRSGPGEIDIVGNALRGGYRAAIEFASGSSDMKDVNISGNMIVEAGNGGRLAPAPGLGGGSAIVVRSSTAGYERVSITGNIISAPRLHGIWLKVDDTGAGTIRDVTIADNQVWVNPSASYIADGGSGVICDLPARNVTDVRIDSNTTRSTLGPGISISGRDVGGTLTARRFDIAGNLVIDAGGGAGGQNGIEVNSVEDVTITRNRAYGQDIGLGLNGPRGSVVLVGNDLVRNTDGAVFYSAGTPGPDRLRVRDNPGFSPWTGRVTITGGWSGLGPFTKESLPITFGMPFPPGKPPRVVVTGEDVDAAGAAASVNTSDFKARLVASANLGIGSHKAVWTAEPDDNSNGD